MRARIVLLSALAISSLAACSAILGFEPLTRDDAAFVDSGADAGDGGMGGDGAAMHDGTAMDAPGDSTMTGDDGAGDDGGEDAGDARAEDGATDAGDGAIACVDGSASLGSDKANCGYCGHDCLGGDCTSGKCQPITLANNQTDPQGLAVDSDWVYVAGYMSMSVSRFKKDGSDAQVITNQSYQPLAITVDENTVYWTVQGGAGSGLQSCPKTGCGAQAPADIYSNGINARSLVVYNNQLFWSDPDNGTILRAGLDGGSLTALVQEDAGMKPQSLALLPPYFYFTDLSIGNVYRIQPDGGGLRPIVAIEAVGEGIFADDGGLFWTIDSEGYDNGLVQSSPLTADGGPPGKTISTAQPQPYAIIADDKNIYWTTLGNQPVPTQGLGGVSYCPRTGCPASGPITLASQQKGPVSLVQDDKALYWSCVGLDDNNYNDGSVNKIAKP